MDDLDPLDEPEGAAGEAGKAGILADSLRKVLVTGLSAVFMTEEGIRSAMSDMKLPKEAIGYLVQQTGNSRRELFRVVTRELKNFLSNADLAGVMRSALAGMKVEVKAEIRFVDGGGVSVDSVTTRTGSVEPSPDAPRGRPRRRT